MTKPIQHPIIHDMHYGAPDGCSRHSKLGVGSFHDRDLKDASDIVEMIMGRMCTNKMLRYLGQSDGVHRYVYSYDSYTLGVVEFPAPKSGVYTRPVRFISTGNYGSGPSDEDDVYTTKEFLDLCRSKSFVDYDGYGHPVKDGKSDPDIRVQPSRCDLIPSDATHVVWYNK